MKMLINAKLFVIDQILMIKSITHHHKLKPMAQTFILASPGNRKTNPNYTANKTKN